MPPKRPVIGDTVEVKFWDHAENSKDALLFEVFGRISGVTSKAYLIRSWGYINEVDRAGDGNPDNENSYAIVKKAIDSIRVLK
jgi:hypothetical protein